MNFWKRNRTRKELQQFAEDRIRDEKLNSVILNDCNFDAKKKLASKPYDVDYGNASSQTKSSQGIKKGNKYTNHMIMVQLVGNTELSSRKFVLNPMNIIRIGSGFENNDIVVANGNISEVQCEIFCMGEKICIRNKGDIVRTIVKRKREKTIVNDKGLCLMSGDCIILGNITYDITFINV